MEVLGDETFQLEIQDDGAIPRTRNAPSLKFYFSFFLTRSPNKIIVIQLKEYIFKHFVQCSYEPLPWVRNWE